MPTATNGDVSLYYEVDATDAEETVAFVGDTGYGAWQWGWQHAAVSGPYETIVTDLRGAGRSDVPDGPYRIEDMVGDLDAVLADADVGSVHLVGAGLGGMVALQYALTTSRVRSLALVGTAAHGDELNLDPLFGAPDDPAALEASLEAVFSREFVENQPDVIDQIVQWRAAEDAGRQGWEAQVAAVQAFDIRDSLYELTTPAKVFHGTDDRVWPVERGRRLAEDLPRGEFQAVEGAGHLAHIEHSRVVNDELLGFLDKQTPD